MSTSTALIDTLNLSSIIAGSNKELKDVVDRNLEYSALIENYYNLLKSTRDGSTATALGDTASLRERLIDSYWEKSKPRWNKYYKDILYLESRFGLRSDDLYNAYLSREESVYDKIPKDLIKEWVKLYRLYFQ